MGTILISDDVHEKLREYCKKSGLKIKVVVDKAIEKFLKEER